MKVRMRSFQKTVTASGTPEVITPNQILTQAAKIKALSTNTGSVFIGYNDVQLYELAKGDELNLTELFEKDGGSADIDLHEVWCKVAANGDKICVIYADRTNPLR